MESPKSKPKVLKPINRWENEGGAIPEPDIPPLEPTQQDAAEEGETVEVNEESTAPSET